MITFNGEIYNFEDIRAELRGLGINCRGRSDTEVLVEALAQWGPEAIAKVDGMFAFAAFDQETGELFMARDPFGEKPLYYAELKAGGIAFASELQALEHVPGCDLEVSIDSVSELLAFQYIGAPRTIYRSIRKLAPGHWLRASAGKPPEIVRYFEFDPGSGEFDLRPLPELADELEDILERSMRRRLIADVPLGAFLSGGVDSSTVCALIRRKLGRPLETFSIGFKGASESEHKVARAFASHLKTKHRECVLAPHASEFLRDIGRVLDEPNADSSCLPTYLLSRFARESVKVAISGDGGDEMFGGYGRYLMTLEEQSIAERSDRADWLSGAAYYSDRILIFNDVHLRELIGDAAPVADLLLRSRREEVTSGDRPLFSSLRKTDVANYLPGAVLPKVDRMSMQHALEVRTPFLSVELARFVERLPASSLFNAASGKVILREIAYRYLPRELIDLPKQGFGLPVTRWGEKELLKVAAELLNSDDSRLRQMLGSQRVDAFIKRQTTAGQFSTYQTWAVCVAESWLRHHPCKIPSTAGDAASMPQLSEPLVAKHLSGEVFVLAHAGSSGEPNSETEDVAAIEILLRSGAWRCALPRSPARDTNVSSIQPSSRYSVSGPNVKKDCIPAAQLIVVDPDIVRILDTGILESLCDAGAIAVLFPHPFRIDGALMRLQLRRSFAAADASELRKLAVATWRGSEAAFGARTTVVGPLLGLPAVRGKELSHRFLLFEDTSQLAPVPASHSDVEGLGRGRYSIWERHCHFSKRTTRAAPEYFLVEHTAATDRYLRFSSSIVPRPWPDVAPFVSALGELVQQRNTTAPTAQIDSRPIVVLTHALPTGGAERQWCYLAVALQRMGRKVILVLTESLKNGSHYLPVLKRAGIEVVEIARLGLSHIAPWLPHDHAYERLFSEQHSPFGIRLLQLSSYLRRENPSAVISQLDSTNLLAGVASLIADVPRIVLSFRNYRPTRFSYLNVPWFKPVYERLVHSQRVMLAGNSVLGNQDYAEWLDIPSARITHIRNAIDIEDLESDPVSNSQGLRLSLGLRQDQPLLMGVFRLSEEKDPLAFVDVCERVFRANQDCAAVIVGEGPLKDTIERRVLSLGLEGKLKLLGPLSDVGSLMKEADVLLLTSRYEGAPNVALEAQFSGLPVVATRVGGVEDIVVDGQTGFLCESGDVQGLAEACLALLNDTELARRLGGEAMRRMRDYFTKEQMARAYLRLIEPGDSVSDSSNGRYARVLAAGMRG